jgi:hypothetical protein
MVGDRKTQNHRKVWPTFGYLTAPQASGVPAPFTASE